MQTISDYNIIETIYDGSKTIVYRGLQQQNPDKKTAILKMQKSEFPTPEETNRFKQEYYIQSDLNLTGTIRAYCLKTYQNRLVLILEDIGGLSLKDYLVTHQLSLLSFLKIALKIVAALAELHQHKIIHKDIKPKNIIINPETEVIKLTDLGISSRLSTENFTLNNPNLLEGTLAYISPEQTGRMNCSLDYRTDLYSLGVTFYEMLTGQLPCINQDPMGLIHCHIAVIPVAVTQLNFDIPPIISDIIMKLLSKTADARYQTAWGLYADLKKCLELWEKTEKVTSFPLGTHDLSGRLLISQKLYGRIGEFSSLINAFERVTNPRNQSGTEMVLVSGNSGVGKSSLINEFHKPIIKKGGHFITGKYDQYQRNIPYSGLSQACQELIQQLLTEKSDNLKTWQEQILAAVGKNGQILIDFIPELALIIGEQPEIITLNPQQSLNRFYRVFKDFFQVFCQPKHPVVLFLDDLQWADISSLKLVEFLMLDCRFSSLLILGTYRDNEVDNLHPLMQTIEYMEAHHCVINYLVLSPLSLSDVNLLIQDTFAVNRIKSLELATLIFKKTQGNPFFINQLLKLLYKDGLINFDFAINEWIWNIAKIEEVGVTDNVLKLMINKIQNFLNDTQKVMQLAACIGNKFDLETLSIIHEKNTTETSLDLWPSLQEGLVLSADHTYNFPLIGEETLETLNFMHVNYKFLHDQVQQAAYTLIPHAMRKATHLKIGQLLLQNMSIEAQKENIFELVNQLNYGVDLINAQGLKYQLAELNLIAGQRAIASFSYKSATQYLQIALDLLTESSWKTNYELTLQVYLTAIDAEYLNGNFTQAKNLASESIKYAQTILEQVNIWQKVILIYIAENDKIKAIELGQKILALMGIELTILDHNGIWFDTLPDGENLPRMTDPNLLAAMNILMLIAPSAYVADFSTYLQVLLTMIDLSLEHGYSPLSAFAFSNYGLILCAMAKQLKAGYNFGEFALQLLEKFPDNRLNSKVYLGIYGYIGPWHQHLRKILSGCLIGIQNGLEYGDIEFAGYHSISYCENLLFSGESLGIVRDKLNQYTILMESFKQQFHTNYLQLWDQFILNLQGLAQDPCQITGNIYDEKVMLPALIEAKLHTSIASYYLAKMILAYLLKRIPDAIENGRLGLNYSQSLMGASVYAEYNFYYSLSLLRDAANLPNGIQQEYLDLVDFNQKEMAIWAENAPMNYQHKYDLVAAEKARIKQDHLTAMEYFDRAIKGAKEEGYVQEEALANELAAEFYLSMGREKIAKTYINDAYYGYITWGAKIKEQDLINRYSLLIVRQSAPITPLTPQIGINLTSTSSNTSKILDLSTVLKSSQAMASEIFLDKLLDQMIHIIMENAGAQIVYLLTEESGELVVKAMGEITSANTINNSEIKSIEELPISLINYVKRTLKSLIIKDATQEELFSKDPYIQTYQPKSILCLPIVQKGKLKIIIYLENNLITGAFTQERLEVLKLLSTQISISLENAQLYHNLSVVNAQLEDYSHTLEDKVVERTKQLASANQDLRDFAHVISHDLKAPLRSIGTIAKWLVTDYAEKLDDDGKEQLNLLMSQVKSSQELISGILSYSRIGSKATEKIATNINDLITKVIKNMTIPPHIKLKINSDFPTIICDPIQMQQVFQNLISNAIKYMDKTQGEINIDCQDKDDVWQFRVADNGPGIEAQYFDQIFGLFQTITPGSLKEVQLSEMESSGVGLAIVKKIVELYGGKVWVESQVGIGSTFYFVVLK